MCTRSRSSKWLNNLQVKYYRILQFRQNLKVWTGFWGYKAFFHSGGRIEWLFKTSKISFIILIKLFVALLPANSAKFKICIFTKSKASVTELLNNCVARRTFILCRIKYLNLGEFIINIHIFIWHKYIIHESSFINYLIIVIIIT